MTDSAFTKAANIPMLKTLGITQVCLLGQHHFGRLEHAQATVE